MLTTPTLKYNLRNPLEILLFLWSCYYSSEEKGYECQCSQVSVDRFLNANQKQFEHHWVIMDMITVLALHYDSIIESLWLIFSPQQIGIYVHLYWKQHSKRILTKVHTVFECWFKFWPSHPLYPIDMNLNQTCWYEKS